MHSQTDHAASLLGPLVHTAVVLPSHHLHLVRGPVGAVGGRDDVARPQHGAATEMEVVGLPSEADLEGDGVGLGLLSTNNPASLALPSGEAEAETRQRTK